jgi:hypothetical protein
VKIRFKIVALLFCMAMLGFIVIGNRESMSGVGTILAGGIVAFFGASAAGDYCRSRFYRPELDDRNGGMQ